jgi:hypothetical protein
MELIMSIPGVGIWFSVTADMVEAAILTADALGSRYKKALR